MQLVWEIIFCGSNIKSWWLFYLLITHTLPTPISTFHSLKEGDRYIKDYTTLHTWGERITMSVGCEGEGGLTWHPTGSLLFCSAKSGCGSECSLFLQAIYSLYSPHSWYGSLDSPISAFLFWTLCVHRQRTRFFWFNPISNRGTIRCRFWFPQRVV